MPTITERATRTISLPRGRSLDLSAPVVMGILNVTPDSFWDGGRHPDAAARARLLVAEGAAIVDVGGESTRPGARPVAPDEEAARVLPVLDALRQDGLVVPVSIDTRRASVAEAALAAGATIVNDVSGLADPAMAGVVAAAGAAVIIGHLRGTPETMQQAPRYEDVVAEVGAELAAARDRAIAAGVAADRVLIDPGIGFGKTLQHNLALLAALPRLAAIAPVCVGLSRKSSLGALLGGRPVEGRLAAGLGGAVFCALRGASIVRTHDVLPTVDALTVALALARAEGEGAHAA